jgi:hypothetical protein
MRARCGAPAPVKLAVKLVLALVGTWVLCCVAALVLLGVSAAMTERWSAGRVGPVVLGLLVADALLFAGGLVVAWAVARRIVTESATRIALLLGLVVVQAASYALLGFVTLLAFNR